MALTKCKVCGTAVSSDAKTCPKCGKPQGMATSTKVLIGLGVLAAPCFLCLGFGALTGARGKERGGVEKKVAVGSVPAVAPPAAPASQPVAPAPSDPPASPPPPAPSGPWEGLLSGLQDFSVKYEAAPNDVKKSMVFNSAREFDTAFFKKTGNVVTDWQGSVESMATDKGGKNLSFKVKVGTRGEFRIEFEQGYTFEETMGGMGIKPGSAVYKQVAELTEGQCVRFSGKVTPHEGSSSESGAMSEPEYRIAFTSVKPCQ